MEKDLQHVGCPACGSPDVTCSAGFQTFDVPFVGPSNILIYVDRCPKCGMKGDFFNRNDALIEAGLHRAGQAFINRMVQWMVDKKISFPYLERILELPFGSVNRWLRGDFSEDAIALLRYVRLYPWLLSVAEGRFNPDTSCNSLREAAMSTVRGDAERIAESVRRSGQCDDPSAAGASRGRAAGASVSWRDVNTERPEIRRPILMKGDSGYVVPHDVFYVAGFFDPEFRPLSPWLDAQHECISDRGWIPTRWIYVGELESKIKESDT
jgi:hypothetical protein